MTRHRDKAAIFVARNTAKDVAQLARQMARTEDRRAASMFEPKQHIEQQPVLSPADQLAKIAPQVPSAAPAQSAGVEPWMQQSGGYDALSAEHKKSAARSYEIWATEKN